MMDTNTSLLSFLIVISLSLTIPNADALDIRITEVLVGSSLKSFRNVDWLEITNFGLATHNITGTRITTSVHTDGEFAIAGTAVIRPSESVVLTGTFEDNGWSEFVDTWRAAWGLTKEIPVHGLRPFSSSGIPMLPREAGNTISVENNLGEVIHSVELSEDLVSGISYQWDRRSISVGFSSVGIALARSSFEGDDIGSPGSFFLRDNDLTPGRNSTNVNELTSLGRHLFFTSQFDGNFDKELWQFDAFGQLTQITDLSQLAGNGSAVRGLTAIKDWLYFSADDSIYGRELWRWKYINNAAQVPDPPELVVDFRKGRPGSNPQNMIECGHALYWSATGENIASNKTRTEIVGFRPWKLTGILGTPKFIEDVDLEIPVDGALYRDPTALFCFTESFVDKVFFTATSDKNLTERMIYELNTETFEVSVLTGTEFPATEHGHVYWFVHEKSLFFTLPVGPDMERLCRFTSSSSAPICVTDVECNLSLFTKFQDKLFFRGDCEESNLLYLSLGDIENALSPLVPEALKFKQSSFTNPSSLIVYRKYLWFIAEGVSGSGLWKYDGRTVLELFIANSVDVYDRVPVNSPVIVHLDRLWFIADEGLSGKEFHSTVSELKSIEKCRHSRTEVSLSSETCGIELFPDTISSGRRFGESLAVDSDDLTSSVLVIGATSRSDNDTGAVYIFSRVPRYVDSRGWKQVQRISAPESSECTYEFGSSVELSRRHLAVKCDTNTSSTVFMYQKKTIRHPWQLLQTISSLVKASSISLFREWFAVGMSSPGVAFEGSVSLFRYSSKRNKWFMAQNFRSSEYANGSFAGKSSFGHRVSISQRWLTVSAPLWNNRGAVFSYKLVRGSWESTSIPYIQPETFSSPSRFGWSMDLDGSTLLVGSRDTDTNGAWYMVDLDVPAVKATRFNRIDLPFSTAGENAGSQARLFNETILINQQRCPGSECLSFNVHEFSQRKLQDDWEYSGQLQRVDAETDDEDGISLALGSEVTAIGAPSGEILGVKVGIVIVNRCPSVCSKSERELRKCSGARDRACQSRLKRGRVHKPIVFEDIEVPTISLNATDISRFSRYCELFGNCTEAVHSLFFERPWQFHPTTNETQIEALVDLYRATDGTRWKFKWTQINSTDPCFDRWYGVRCDTLGNIVSIDLAHNGLAGTVPPSIGFALRKLKTLDLSNNLLHGMLPSELGKLTRLRSLNLSSNRFSGSIEWIHSLPLLEYLNTAQTDLETDFFVPSSQ